MKIQIDNKVVNASDHQSVEIQKVWTEEAEKKAQEEAEKKAQEEAEAIRKANAKSNAEHLEAKLGITVDELRDIVALIDK